jgi:hypothetical protein
MQRDLRSLLEDWPHDPDRLNAQMEVEGRPDGGADVLARVEAEVQAEPTRRIDPELAAELRHEAVQVHQRYVAMLALERYGDVVKDTSRNLRMFDLCRERAADPDDRSVLEQFRPQVIATRARAAALLALRDERIPEARRLLDEAAAEIRRSLDPGGPEPPECAMLEGMRDVLQPRLPMSQRHELERRIQAAIASENYELAAILRNELRQLPD